MTRAARKTADSETEQGRDQIIRAAYTAAGRRLREAHHAEFLGYQVEECAERGLTWAPPQTPEQRASATFDQLITEYPFLRDRLPAEQAADGPSEGAGDDGSEPVDDDTAVSA